MMVLVTYDVETTDQGGARRLRRMAKACEDYGQRVQKSVFECVVEPAQWKVLEARLLSIMDKERDSLRVYMLGANWQRRVEHHGVKLSYTQEEPIVL